MTYDPYIPFIVRSGVDIKRYGELCRIDGGGRSVVHSFDNVVRRIALGSSLFYILIRKDVLWPAAYICGVKNPIIPRAEDPPRV